MNRRPHNHQQSEPRVIALAATVSRTPIAMIATILASVLYAAYVMLFLLQ